MHDCDWEDDTRLTGGGKTIVDLALTVRLVGVGEPRWISARILILWPSVLLLAFSHRKVIDSSVWPFPWILIVARRLGHEA